MARVTKTDTAQNFGKNDEVLKQFAKGEDVGHGVDHDCPACRQNRSALAKAGLHASDIKGLEGGKPPEGDSSGQPPQARTAFVPPNVSQDLILGPSNAAPDVDGLKQITARIGAPPVDEVLSPFTEPDPKVGQPMEERSPLPLATDVAARHVRLLTLSSELDEALIRQIETRGFDIDMLPFEDDQDIADAIVEAGGRYMLMNGFMPDNRDWHCEIGFGGERAAVRHPNKGIAIRLCALLALDPKSGAKINSGFMQLEAERKTPTTWVGTGVQP